MSLLDNIRLYYVFEMDECPVVKLKHIQSSVYLYYKFNNLKTWIEHMVLLDLANGIVNKGLVIYDKDFILFLNNLLIKERINKINSIFY